MRILKVEIIEYDDRSGVKFPIVIERLFNVSLRPQKAEALNTLEELL